jgi:hypothetical protein
MSRVTIRRGLTGTLSIWSLCPDRFVFLSWLLPFSISVKLFYIHAQVFLNHSSCCSDCDRVFDTEIVRSMGDRPDDGGSKHL